MLFMSLISRFIERTLGTNWDAAFEIKDSGLWTILWPQWFRKSCIMIFNLKINEEIESKFFFIQLLIIKILSILVFRKVSLLSDIKINEWQQFSNRIQHLIYVPVFHELAFIFQNSMSIPRRLLSMILRCPQKLMYFLLKGHGHNFIFF